MNVLHLTADYIPNPLWGMGHYVYTLVNGLSTYVPDVNSYVATAHKSNGIHQNVITTDEITDIELLSSTQDQIFNDFNKFLKWEDELAIKILDRVFLNFPIDIIHCNNWMSWHTAKKLQKATGGKIVSSIHFLQKQYESMNENPIPNNHNDIMEIEKEMLRESSAVICFSEQTKKVIKKEYIYYCPNIHIINHTASFEKPVIDLQKKEPYMLVYLGRVTEDKGITDVLRVVHILFKEYPNLCINIIGDGILLNNIRREKYSYIKIYGYVSDKKIISRILSKSSISLNLSTAETFPLSVVESMMCGTLPIVTDTPAFPSMFENNKSGIRIPLPKSKNGQRNIDYLLNKLRFIFDNKEYLYNMQKEAMCYYDNHYSLKKMVLNTHELYKTLLSKRY